ncbi:MAG: hypothetical protein WBQ08_14700 [Candidatus Sulfotelmatobacter sp.]
MSRSLIWLLSQPLFWAVLSVVLGPYFFLRGFALLHRKRLVMDIPRSTVRAAALGSVELTGRAVGPYALVAPLSKADCLYYRIAIESNPQGDLRKRTQEMCVPLFLDDGTGIVMIYPEGSELQLEPSCDRSEYGKLALAASGYLAGTPEFAQEYCIKPGDRIFVLGTLQENPWAKKDPIAECDELSRIGPGFVSEDEADLLRREAFPGLDPALPSGIALDSPVQFDLHPPVILMRGKGPFVISDESQRDLVATLNLKSILYIWGGPAALLWGLWEILNHARLLEFRF